MGLDLAPSVVQQVHPEQYGDRQDVTAQFGISRPAAEMMLGEVQNKVEDARGAAYGRLAQWMLNAAFYRGHQWGTTTELGHLPQFEFDDPIQARERLNYTRAFVRTGVANMLSHIPNPEVVSNSSDQQGVARAEASHRLVRSFVIGGQLDYAELMKCEIAAQIFGGCWWKSYWDVTKGKDRQRQYRWHLGPDGKPQPDMDPFGQQRFDTQRAGDIRGEAVDVIDALPNPDATRPSEVRYVVHRKRVARGVLDDTFPVDAFGHRTHGRWSVWNVGIEGGERDFIQRSQSAEYSSYWPHSQADDNELCELVEYWEKPTNRYPGGRLLVFSGDTILAIGPLPFDFPWRLRMGQNMMHSELYADGMVYDLVPLQRSINHNASKMREWMDRILTPGLLAPRGANIQLDQVSDVAGWVASYNPGLKPEYIDTPQIPNSAFSYGDVLLANMKDVSTYSDVSRGEMPPGAESGRAIAYLHELERGVHGPDVHLFRLFVSGILQDFLGLARDFYEDDRMMQVLGPNDEWSKVPFRRQDYDFDVAMVVEPLSGAPESRALRHQEVMEGFDRGLFSDTPDAERARSMLRWDTNDRKAFDYEQADRTEARRENQMFLDWVSGGQEPLMRVSMAEDVDVHLDEHNALRKTAEYKNLPPEAQMVFEQHVQETEMLRDWLMMSEMQQAGMMPGGPQMGPPPIDQGGGGGLPPPDGGGGGVAMTPGEQGEMSQGFPSQYGA